MEEPEEQERAVKCRLLGKGCPCDRQLSPAVAAAAYTGLTQE